MTQRAATTWGLVRAERERGRLLHEAWRRDGFIDAIAQAALAGLWLIERTVRSRARAPRARAFSIANDVLVGATLATGLARWIARARLAQQASATEEVVPLLAGGRPSLRNPERERGLVRTVGVLGTANIVIGALAVGSGGARALTSGRRRGAWTRLAGGAVG